MPLNIRIRKLIKRIRSPSEDSWKVGKRLPVLQSGLFTSGGQGIAESESKVLSELFVKSNAS